jgi:hypothetical protein
MSQPKLERASTADRAHLARVAREMRALDDEVAPASLREALERMDQILLRLGSWAQPGIEGESDGDLYAHLAIARGPRAKDSDVR